MRSPDKTFWNGQKVFLTGHTGFKGGWLATWLLSMGAEVFGYALSPNTEPRLFDCLWPDGFPNGVFADIRDLAALKAAMTSFQPTVLFHMAAQPLVRLSYAEPIETFHTNVVGTANVLEAARSVASLRAIVSITTDKCYENLEQIWPYREPDRLGGKDPYSASKACAELVSAAYHWSYFGQMPTMGSATVRAGNVIGGGDWSLDRLVPDMAKAFASDQPCIIRRPDGVRPWQHVLEPICGYLLAAEKVYGTQQSVPQSWNFGPDPQGNVPVGELAEIFARLWGGGANLQIRPELNAPHEAGLLTLDSSKAKVDLGWRPRLNLERSLEMTAEWYKEYYRGGDVRAFSHLQIDQFLSHSA